MMITSDGYTVVTSDGHPAECKVLTGFDYPLHSMISTPIVRTAAISDRVLTVVIDQ